MNLAALERLIRERIGLDVASIGVATLPRVVEARMASRGITSDEAYTAVATNDSSEWSALIGELVVPESWFFRGGAEFFDHIARWVRTRLNEWPNGRTLRVLCVPCSTGEEPYSLAIDLEREGVPAARVQIDAVDLARDHLLRAVAGRYTAFSFRESGPDPRPSYFREVEAGKWELRHEYRDRVRFRPGNLVEPGFLANEPPYDLILCRNLFIYLTPDGRARALANLDRLLATDGRLCLTPAEADRMPATQFVPDGSVSLAIFKRGNDASGPRSGILLRKDPSPSPSPKRGGGQEPSTVSLQQPLPKLTEVQDPTPPSLLGKGAGGLGLPLNEGRKLADAGQLDAARTICENALEASSPSAPLFSLLGVIHRAAGRTDDASDAFRKALYLDPDHAEALSHMIVLCEQRGDPDQAAGLRRRLDRIDKGAAT